MVEETAFYNRPTVPTGSTAALTDSEVDAVKALKDLSVGERVAVGYHSGVLHNSVYAIIKASRAATT